MPVGTRQDCPSLVLKLSVRHFLAIVVKKASFGNSPLSGKPNEKESNLLYQPTHKIEDFLIGHALRTKSPILELLVVVEMPNVNRFICHYLHNPNTYAIV